MAGEGTSAGGITIGGAITQRPELFGAALIRVGDSNALREETQASGPANIPEFGTVTEPDGFKALFAMDAYQHVKANTPYPAVLLTTGVNDPRVAPWEAAKMAARLQASTSSGKPILLRVDYDAGHGMGSTKSQHDIELADELVVPLLATRRHRIYAKRRGALTRDAHRQHTSRLERARRRRSLVPQLRRGP